MKQSLRDAFDIKVNNKKTNIINDYEIFKDKELLDKLRTEIVENLVDNKIPQDTSISNWINEEIDKTVEGYDFRMKYILK